MPTPARIFGAELLGTAVIVIAGVGASVLAGVSVGALGIALAFGLATIAMTLALGPISGAHLNPAVTLGLLLARRVSRAAATFALLGQVVGALLGGLVVYGIASGVEGWDRGQFGANGWGDGSPGGYGLGSVIVAEIVFSALFVFVVLTLRSGRHNWAGRATATGLTLLVIHLVTGSIDGTGVNPAKSLATAVFSDWDLSYIKQVWAFLLFPLVGSVVGVFAWLFVDDATIEDTMLDASPLRAARDAGDDLAERATGAIEDVVG